MERKLLVKTFENYNTAHLYEHIFCDALSNYLQSSGFYNYLDYCISAVTYSFGIIHIEVNGYTKGVIDFLNNFIESKISLTEEAITIAIMQISAEKGTAYSGDSKAIMNSVNKLNESSWIFMDSAAVLPIRQVVNRSQTIIAATDDPKLNIDKLKTSIRMAQNTQKYLHEHLESLFFVISRAIHSNVYEKIIPKYGFFLSKDTVFHKGNATVEYSAVREFYSDYSDIKKDSTDSFNFIVKSKSFKKSIKNFLLNTKYNRSMLAPNELEVLESTAYLVGSSGWKKLAKDGNIDLILGGLEIKFNY